MTESHYEQIIRESLRRFRELHNQREQADIELIKLKQFLYATLEMVDADRRSKWEENINGIVSSALPKTAPLAESIRKVFQENPNMVYSVGSIREKLTERGFDFSRYKSNPLSSISTTLRRMVETGELITTETTDGPTMFMPRESLLDSGKAETELLKKMVRHGSQVPRRRG